MILPCPPSLHPIEPMLELDRTANVFREELNTNGLHGCHAVTSFTPSRRHASGARYFHRSNVMVVCRVTDQVRASASETRAAELEGA